MPHQLPTNAHDLALWLYDTLEGITPLQGTGVEGRLPDKYDFNLVATHIEQVSEKLNGHINEAARIIEFHPSLVGVYSSLSQLLRVEANRKQAPAKFSVLTPRYTYPSPAGTKMPEEIAQYIEATRLWSTVNKLADIPESNNALFVISHDALLEVRPDYDTQHLVSLPSLPELASEFVNSTTHTDQKRSIFRSCLIEHFRPRRQISLADLIPHFEAIATDAKRSYAMYMAEFSYQKIRSEVEKQNLEDTLRLNKTLADIQNQLLALPAAILLAGATISTDTSIRNYAVLAGVWVFCIFIILLIINQRHSVDAISSEIRLRKNRIEKLPGNEKGELISLFDSLKKRVSRQCLTLHLITVVVVAIALLTTFAVIAINSGLTLQDFIDYIQSCGIHPLASSSME